MTEHKDEQGSTIKARFEVLQKRLDENLGWNMAEKDNLDKLEYETRLVVLNKKISYDVAYKNKLIKMYDEASATMANNYENRVEQMKKGDGWRDIMNACDKIRNSLRNNGDCIQSTTELEPLYKQALEIHDNRLWQYSEADHLHDVKEKQAVKGEKKIKGAAHKVRRTGKVIKIEHKGPKFSLKKKKWLEGTVTIEWDACEGFDALGNLIHFEAETEMKPYRFKKKPFEEALAKYNDITGVRVSVGPIKKLYRLVEKLLRQGNRLKCGAIKDVVRTSLVCDTNADICKVLDKLASDPSFTIRQVKEGYSNPVTGAWLDIKLIVTLTPPATAQALTFRNAVTEVMKESWHVSGHLCELQIYHKDMDDARTHMGGHEVYNRVRSLKEAINTLEVNDAEMDELEKRFLDVMTKGTEEQKERVGRMLSSHKNFRELAGQWIVHGGSDTSDLRFLDQYPEIALGKYKNDPNFWFINKKYSGLRAVSKDPWIFVVPNLLSPQRCNAIMGKVASHLCQSESYHKGSYGENENRTSWDVYIPNDEMKTTQSIFKKVLNMEPTHMEPPKVLRYRKVEGKEGERFNSHHDAKKTEKTGYNANGARSGNQIFCDKPFANRVVTLFVYLNTPESGGGETDFLNAKGKIAGESLKIQPHTGMGVIHFPAHLDTSSVFTVPESELLKNGKVSKGMKVRVLKDGKGSFVGTVEDAPDRVTQEQEPFSFICAVRPDDACRAKTESYDLLYDDKYKESNVDASLIRALESAAAAPAKMPECFTTGHKIGQKIEARYRGEAEYYPATITSARSGGMYYVRKIELEVLKHMHGEQDERALHAGRPVCGTGINDEKYLLSQWCWPGPYDATKDEHHNGSVNPEKKLKPLCQEGCEPLRM
jgi:hypothetical protein